MFKIQMKQNINTLLKNLIKEVLENLKNPKVVIQY